MPVTTARYPAVFRIWPLDIIPDTGYICRISGRIPDMTFGYHPRFRIYLHGISGRIRTKVFSTRARKIAYDFTFFCILRNKYVEEKWKHELFQYNWLNSRIFVFIGYSAFRVAGHPANQCPVHTHKHSEFTPFRPYRTVHNLWDEGGTFAYETQKILKKKLSL